MEPAGPEQNHPGQESPQRNSVHFTVRPAMVSYLADSLEPVYTRELNALREDGSYQRIMDFTKSPFATIMGQILDKKEAQSRMELPKVSLDMTDEEMKAIRERMEKPIGMELMSYTKMMGELSEQYGSAKFAKRVNDLAKRIKSPFKKK